LRPQHHEVVGHGVGRRGAGAPEDQLVGVPRIRALAPLEDGDLLALHLDEGVRGVVGVVLRAVDDGKPALALCISCAGRKQILGSRTQEEARIVNQLLAGVPAAGFYGYGEIARLAKGGVSHYHNETFTTLLLGGRVGSA